MKDTAYAYCVARIRANEKYLLDQGLIDKLIESESFEVAVNLLKDVGWIEGGNCIKDYINIQNEKLWNLIFDSVPDKTELSCLCVLNDYFNLKCAVKCALTGENPENYFIKPTVINVEELAKVVKEKNFDVLENRDMRTCAKDAFDVAFKTENGQNAEVIIDKATLRALMYFSEKYPDSVFSQVCDFNLDTANIKTAFRCVYAEKNSDFVNESISECKYIDSVKLKSCISEGKEALVNLLMKTRYSEGVELYNQSSVLFEKWCDESVINIVSRAKFTAFGFDPVCAYYYARLNEIKNVRIILTSKQSGLSSDEIRERVRVSYV